jgi:hypothetical protein
VFSHPNANIESEASGEFILKSIYNPIARKAVFMLQSNAYNELAQHFSLMIPAMDIPRVQEASGLIGEGTRICIPIGVHYSAEFYIYSPPGDGNCFFASSVASVAIENVLDAHQPAHQAPAVRLEKAFDEVSTETDSNDARGSDDEGGKNDARGSDDEGGKNDARGSDDEGGKNDARGSDDEGGKNDARGSDDEGGKNDARGSDDEGGKNDARGSDDEGGKNDARGSDDESCSKNAPSLLVRGTKEDTKRSLSEKGMEWARDGLKLDENSVLYKNFKERNVGKIRIFNLDLEATGPSGGRLVLDNGMILSDGQSPPSEFCVNLVKMTMSM